MGVALQSRAGGGRAVRSFGEPGVAMSCGPQACVIVAGSGDHLESLAGQVTRAWPLEPRPSMRVMELGDLASAAQPAGEGDGSLRGLPRGAVVVVSVDQSDTPRGVAYLLESLRECGAGVVVIESSGARGADAVRATAVELAFPVCPSDAGDEVIAGVVYATAVRQRAVESLRRELMVVTSSQAGARGEMNRLHDELSLAAAVQRDSLPKRLPTSDGVDFGVLFRPAGYVSGDLYDFFDAGEGRTGFVIADAVGHGVPAALMTMVISRCLQGVREMMTSDTNGPGLAMERLNEELVRAHQGRANFATAILGMIDSTTGEVRLACAGHPPPLVVGVDSMEPVSVDGALLGVFPGYQYDTRTVRLRAGETLLLYTDGFETAFPSRKEFQEKRRIGSRDYLDHLSRLAWPSRGAHVALADTFVEMAEALDAQQGSLHQVDDVTAIAMTLKPGVGALAGAMQAA